MEEKRISKRQQRIAAAKARPRQVTLNMRMKERAGLRPSKLAGFTDVPDWRGGKARA
jgi:hypothetical protein